jgi:hypothetical protein
MVVALAASSRILDKSVATGMMGMMFPFYALPTLSLALAAWAVLTSRLSDGLRRVTMVATILLAVGVWTLVRTNGMTGEGTADLPGGGRRLASKSWWRNRRLSRQ